MHKIRKSELWYHKLDPFRRPIFNKISESPFNILLAFLLLSTAVIVGYFLGAHWQSTKYTSVFSVGQDDIRAGSLPSGFDASDGEIPLQILAVETSDDFSPRGTGGNHTSVGFTLHDYSCDGTSNEEYVPANTWKQVTLCAGAPTDCKGLSVNASAKVTFLVRGYGDGAGSNRYPYAGYRVIGALRPSDNTGIDMEVAMTVEKDLDSGTIKRFIYPNGKERYNTHVDANTNYCACGGQLCPHYLRLQATPLFSFIRKGRSDFLDTFATIAGFASACAGAGIPLGFMMRGLIGVKYASWEHWLDGSQAGQPDIPMESKSSPKSSSS